MAPLAAGKRDRQIRFERATSAIAEPSGEVRLTWAVEAIAWAAVEPLSGREMMQAQELEARIDTRFRVLWRPGITPDETLRIEYGGRHFDIRHVAELGRRDELEILAEARAE